MLLDTLLAVLKVLGAQPLTPLLDVCAGDGQLAQLLRRHFAHVEVNESQQRDTTAELRQALGAEALWHWAQRRACWVVSRPLSPAVTPAALADVAALVHEAFRMRGLHTVLIVPSDAALGSFATPGDVRESRSWSAALLASIDEAPYLAVHVAPQQAQGFSVLAWAPSRMTARTVTLDEAMIERLAAVPSAEAELTHLFLRELDAPRAPLRPQLLLHSRRSNVLRPEPRRPHTDLKTIAGLARATSTAPDARVSFYKPSKTAAGVEAVIAAAKAAAQTTAVSTPGSPTHSSEEAPSPQIALMHTHDDEDGAGNVQGLEAAAQGLEIVRLIHVYRHSMPKREVIAKVCKMKYRSAQRKIRIAKFIDKFPEIGAMTQRQAEQYLSEMLSRRPSKPDPHGFSCIITH